MVHANIENYVIVEISKQDKHILVEKYENKIQRLHH